MTQPSTIPRYFVLTVLCVVLSSPAADGQDYSASTPAPREVPTIPADRQLPPGVGPGVPTFPGAPPMPGAPPGLGARQMPTVPGAPAGAGAQSMMPNEPAIPAPTQHIPVPQPKSTTSTLISLLDSTTPTVQAFDFLMMIVAGMFCLRARKAPGLLLLAIACFVSALILFGFFLFSVMHGSGLFAQTAYVVARLIAPIELLLFAIAIVRVARARR